MVISKKNNKDNVTKCEITVNGTKIDQVREFLYLGQWVTDDGRSDKEVKRRIGMAKTAFNKVEKMVTNRKMNMKTRKRIINCYVTPVLMYGMETWVIGRAMKKKLEAMEMWIWRRMCKIGWKKKMMNTEVLKLVNEKVNE